MGEVRPARRRAWAAPAMLAALAAVAGLAGVVEAAPRFEYTGSVLPARQVETLAQPALRAPRDSAALGRTLGAVVARLQDLGYLDARAEAVADSAPERLWLVVREGRRYAVRSVRLELPGGPDSAQVAADLGLVAGGWASPRAADQAVERALRAALERGHAYASLGVAGWDADSGGVAIRVAGDLGPRVTVTRAQVSGLAVTRAALAERALGRIVGGPFRPSTAEAARDRLAQLGLFRSVTFEGLESEPDPARGRLLYRVEEPHYNRFEGVVGVQGQTGTVGLAHLDLGNLLGTGRALGLHWEGRGHGVSELMARYAEPLVFGTPLRLETAVTQQVQDTLYVRTRWGGRASLPIGAQERIEAGYEQERVVQASGELEEAGIQSTVFAIERNALDDPRGARRGSRTRLSATQSYKRERLRPPGTRRARSGAGEGVVELARPLGGSSGLDLELSAAGRFSSQRVLPVFERYPVGGTRTLRGFDEEAFRVDRYALSRLEYRRFLGPGAQRVFLFWDHAWMETRRARPEGGDVLETAQRDGVGFGLRLEAAGGLLGVEYGLEPGRPVLEGKIHLQLVSTF